MCSSAVAWSNKLCIVVTIDRLVGVQRSAIVRCADFLLIFFRIIIILYVKLAATSVFKHSVFDYISTVFLKLEVNF